MKFKILNMNCGGCAESVTATIKEVDSNAEVTIDLNTKLVEVITTASLEAVKTALGDDDFLPISK